MSARRLLPLALRLLVPIMATTAVHAEPAPVRAPAPAQIVHIHGFAFSPAVLTVTPGTTVTWINEDEDPHSVVATGHTFHSVALDTGDRYSFTFNTPGDFAYFCSLHPHMTGRIVVRAR
jgi:plastocyanin